MTWNPSGRQPATCRPRASVRRNFSSSGPGSRRDRADPAIEQEPFAALVDAEPGNIAAWDRLAELALLAGRKTEAEDSRRRKAEFNDLGVRYKKLLDRDDRVDQALELARLAARLGRRAEARGWAAIAEGRPASGPLLTGADFAESPGSARKLEPLISDPLPARRLRSPGSTATHAGIPPRFVDAAESTGLRFVHDNGHRRGIRHRPKRCAAASRCSITTAMAGSTSTSSRAVHFRRPPPRQPRATVSSASRATAPSRT